VQHIARCAMFCANRSASEYRQRKFVRATVTGVRIKKAIQVGKRISTVSVLVFALYFAGSELEHVHEGRDPQPRQSRSLISLYGSIQNVCATRKILLSLENFPVHPQRSSVVITLSQTEFSLSAINTT
jgi:hypothetical protein